MHEYETKFGATGKVLANIFMALMFVGLVMIPFVAVEISLGIALVSGGLYLGIRALTRKPTSESNSK